MSLSNGKLVLSSNDLTRLRNKAISLGLIDPRDSGVAAVQKAKEDHNILSLSRITGYISS